MEFTSTESQECLVPRPESLVPMIIIGDSESEAENDQAGRATAVKLESSPTLRDDKLSPEQCNADEDRGSKDKGGSIETDLPLSFVVVEGRKTYYCPHCLYNTTWRDDLKSHLITHSEEGAVNKDESVAADPQLAFLVIKGRKIYYCPHCEYRTARGSDLKRHTMTHTGAKPHKCPHCSFSCSQAHHLRQHMMIHLGKKRLNCDECPFSCFKSDDFKRHMFVHTGQRPHQCSVCSYSCSRAGSLKKHMMTHNGERPYQCSVCSFSSAQLGHLKEHLYTHAGKKPYVCPICSYSCRTSGNLSSHVKTHTKVRPYRCNSCSYRSAQVSNLKRHVAKKHP